jgi:hypothetical protein
MYQLSRSCLIAATSLWFHSPKCSHDYATCLQLQHGVAKTMMDKVGNLTAATGNQASRFYLYDQTKERTNRLDASLVSNTSANELATLLCVCYSISYHVRAILPPMLTNNVVDFIVNLVIAYIVSHLLVLFVKDNI